MKLTKLLMRPAILWLLAMTLHVSCRKLEITRTNDDISKEKFFGAHRSGDAAETVVVAYIQRKNQSHPFIVQTIERIGYPRWDKMLKKGAKKTRVGMNGSGLSVSSNQNGNESDVYYVPFARDSQNHVNAVMIITASASDTTISYVNDWQYKRLLYLDASKQKAQQFALSFMMFDKIVFGHKNFRITDPSIFSSQDHAEANSIFVAIGKKEHQQAVKNDMLYYSETCEDVTIFFTNCPYIRTTGNCFGPGGICDRCPECPSVQMDLTFCYGQWLDDGLGGGSGETGGGSGGGGTGGGGGSGPPPTPCDGGGNIPDSKNVEVQTKVKLSGVDPNDPCAPGWEPSDPEPDPEPQMTISEKAIFDQIDAEDLADNVILAGGCNGTNRTGNVKWSGTLEHWLIMYNYVLENPIAGEVEFGVPGASSTGSGRQGYADIVNTITGEIFEVKPNNPQGLSDGRTEVASYVALANTHCPMKPIAIAPAWQKGFTFATRYYQAKRPNEWLEASLAESGVILYRYVPKSSVPAPIPVAIPQTNLDRISRLAKKLMNNLQNSDAVIAEFFRDTANLPLLNYIKAAGVTVGVGIIVGTIVQDILTWGGGLADDWASFMLAGRIIRYARAL